MVRSIFLYSILKGNFHSSAGAISADEANQAEQLLKVLFTKAHMLCHDVNTFTTSPNHLDVVMGASSADIMWFEAFSQKYNRINKNVSFDLRN